MGRVTDTRARVREAAALLRSKGVEPTPTKIRKLLGAGSPNVIVDELRKLREAGYPAEAAQDTVSVRAAEAPGFEKALRELGQEQLAEELEQAKTLQLQLDNTGQMMAQFVQAANELLSELREERSKGVEQLNLALSRFDALSRQMMLIADAARQQQKQERENLSARISELETWQASLRDVASNQRTRIAVLETRLKSAGLPTE